MSFFDLFRKKSTLVTDPVFGQLKHFSSGKSVEFLHGDAHFAPYKKTIGVMVRAGAAGPSEKQREFYKAFQRSFEIYYIPKLKLLIEQEFKTRNDDFVIADFDQEFTLVHMEVPDMGSKPLNWEIAFTTIHKPDHDVTIRFTDEEPTGILIEG